MFFRILSFDLLSQHQIFSFLCGFGQLIVDNNIWDAYAVAGSVLNYTLNLLNPPNDSLGVYYCDPNLSDEETEAQRGL